MTVILDGENTWYVKVLFAGGSEGVHAASMDIGSTNYSMERVSGATWKAHLSGIENQSVSFHASFSDGSAKTITNCFSRGQAGFNKFSMQVEVSVQQGVVASRQAFDAYFAGITLSAVNSKVEAQARSGHRMFRMSKKRLLSVE